MTRDEAIPLLERGLTVRDGLRGAYCQTGEPYVTFSQMGAKLEHEYARGLETEDLALRYWLKYVLQYKVAQVKDVKIPYTLYWRYDPKIDVTEDDGKWFVYSRLVITDQKEKDHA